MEKRSLTDRAKEAAEPAYTDDGLYCDICYTHHTKGHRDICPTVVIPELQAANRGLLLRAMNAERDRDMALAEIERLKAEIRADSERAARAANTAPRSRYVW